ncbi:hypothetical protein HK104_001191, partial [Borealophlyctis nickersoniae]
ATLVTNVTAACKSGNTQGAAAIMWKTANPNGLQPSFANGPLLPQGWSSDEASVDDRLTHDLLEAADLFLKLISRHTPPFSDMLREGEGYNRATKEQLEELDKRVSRDTPPSLDMLTEAEEDDLVNKWLTTITKDQLRELENHFEGAGFIFDPRRFVPELANRPLTYRKKKEDGQGDKREPTEQEKAYIQYLNDMEDPICDAHWRWTYRKIGEPTDETTARRCEERKVKMDEKANEYFEYQLRTRKFLKQELADGAIAQLDRIKKEKDEL